MFAVKQTSKILLAAFSLLAWLSTAQAVNVNLSVSPSPSTVSVGGSFTVTVTCDATYTDAHAAVWNFASTTLTAPSSTGAPVLVSQSSTGTTYTYNYEAKSAGSYSFSALVSYTPVDITEAPVTDTQYGSVEVTESTVSNPPSNPQCLFTGPCGSCSTGQADNGTSAASTTATEQILVDRGEEVYTRLDLDVEGRGMHWKHVRTYRSRRSADSPMGVGWSHPFLDYIVVNGSTLRSYGGSTPGETDRFDDWTVDSGDSSRFLPPAGMFGLFRLDDNGTSGDPYDDSYTQVSREGYRRVYRSQGPAGSGPIRYNLVEIHDACINVMKLYYEDDDRPNLLTRVNDTLGRDIAYRYYDDDDINIGAANRLKEVEDFSGRKVTYDYDTEGNLIEAVSPVVTGTVTSNNFTTGCKETYTYTTGFTDPDLNHNLLTVTRPNENDTAHGLPTDGTPALSWTYDANDRVATHTIGYTSGPGAAGGTFSYAYDNSPSTPGDFDSSKEETAVYKVTETDRKGYVRVYWFDAAGKRTRLEHYTDGIRAGEPTKYMVRNKNDTNLQVASEESASGIVTTYGYSTSTDPRQKGNIVSITITPNAAGGDQTQLQTLYVRDPFYNKPSVVIDPRGTDGSYTPPNGGSASAARYATISTYDYQEMPNNSTSCQLIADHLGYTDASEVEDLIDAHEAEVEAALGLSAGSYTLLGRGDVNGDTKTNGYAGFLVRVDHPTVNLLSGSNQAIAEGDTSQEAYELFAWAGCGQKLYHVDEAGTVTDYVYFSGNDPNGDSDSSEVTDPRGGTGYLSGIVRDNRTVSGTTRLATAAGVPYASISESYTRDVRGNMLTREDGRGNVFTTVYNQLNWPIRKTAPSPYSFVKDTLYDANGNVMETHTQNDVPDTSDLHVQLDAYNNVEMTAGSVTTFTNYFEYDILNSLLKVDQDASTGAGSVRLVTSFQYDANQNLSLITKPEGNKVYTVYDERDFAYQKTTGYMDAAASAITYNYDDEGLPVEIVDAEDTDGVGGAEVMTVEYDGFNRLKKTIDAVGGVVELTYDPAGSIVEQKVYGTVGGVTPTNNTGSSNVLLSETLRQLDERGRVYQTDVLAALSTGISTTRTPVIVDGALSSSDGYVSGRTEFDVASRVTFAVEDDGDVTELQYDALGRAIKTIDLGGNTVVLAYDANSNVIQTTATDKTQTSGNSDETIISYAYYDVLNRRTRTIDGMSNANLYGFDSRGNLANHTDALQNTIAIYYDGSGRNYQKVRAMRTDGDGTNSVDTSQGGGDGYITEYTLYDGNSRVTSLIDDNFNQTRYYYDALDRVTQVEYGVLYTGNQADVTSSATNEYYSYDDDSNVIEKVDQNGSTFTYEYDGLNRKISTSVAYDAGNPHGLVGSTERTYEFNGLGRMTLSTDNNDPSTSADDVVVETIYDTLGRTIEESQTIGTLSTKVFTYDYDATTADAGNTKPNYLTYGDGRKTLFAYDASNRLASINDVGYGTAIASWEYVGAGLRVSRVINGNGTVTTRAYDSNRRLTELQHVKTGSPPSFVDLRYLYDAMGNRLAERKLDSSTQSEVYAYDSAYRITEFARGTVNSSGVLTAATTLTGSLSTRDWAYDGAHNWDASNKQVVGSSASVETRTDTNFNEITVRTVDSTPLTLSNDDAGNQTDNGTYTYEWDAFNRLRTVTSKSSGLLVASYLYDSGNRRMERIVSNSGALNGTTTFYYSGWRVMEEYSRSGSTETLNCQYVWGGTYLDELVVRDDGTSSVSALNDGSGSDRQFQHTNAQFNVYAVTDSSGMLLERYEYDPYGNVLILDATGVPITGNISVIGQEFLYTSQRLDPESGLVNMKCRYYSDSQGIFISRDPMGYVGGMNQYTGYFASGLGVDAFGLDADKLIELVETVDGHPGISDSRKEELQKEAKGSYTWSALDAMRWKASGSDESLYKFKSDFVSGYSETIALLAETFDLPPELIAGVAFAEAGGDPPFYDTAANAVRSFDHAFDIVEPLTCTKRPEMTSYGNVSMQIRRAGEEAGFKKSPKGWYSYSQRSQLINMLKDDQQNLFLVAKHLSGWRDRDFPGKKASDLSDHELSVIGTRYNRGPQPLANIEQNSWYGDQIVGNRPRLKELLSK